MSGLAILVVTICRRSARFGNGNGLKRFFVLEKLIIVGKGGNVIEYLLSTETLIKSVFFSAFGESFLGF